MATMGEPSKDSRPDSLFSRVIRNASKWLVHIATLLAGVVLVLSHIPEFARVFQLPDPILLLSSLLLFCILTLAEYIRELREHLPSLNKELRLGLDNTREDLQKLGESLRRELDENETLLSQLWNVFSEHVAEEDVDRHLREIITRYHDRKKRDRKEGRETDPPTQHARNRIRDAHTALTKDEFQIAWIGVGEYPMLLYKVAEKSICATNIGGVKHGFGQAIQEDSSPFVDYNRNASEKYGNGNKGYIRRVYILEKEDVEEELIKLMDALAKFSEVKIIQEDRARDAVNEKLGYARVDDFTLVTRNDDSMYSGLLPDPKSKVQIISGDVETNQRLREQFEAIWLKAKTFSKGDTVVAVKTKLD